MSDTDKTQEATKCIQLVERLENAFKAFLAEHTEQVNKLSRPELRHYVDFFTFRAIVGSLIERMPTLVDDPRIRAVVADCMAQVQQIRDTLSTADKGRDASTFILLRNPEDVYECAQDYDITRIPKSEVDA